MDNWRTNASTCSTHVPQYDYKKSHALPRERIPITPAVLRWAREYAGLSIDDVRSGFRDVEVWELGESSPTYPQLERLAERYRVPVAVLLFTEPPDVPPIRESFRTLPDAEFDALSGRIVSLLRKAKALQINLTELHDGRNPAERFIQRDLRLSPDMNVPSVARRLRNYLGISIDDQIRWSDADEAFDAWRDALEDHGIAVFKDAFRDDHCSGFCLYDESFPLIYVNNSAKTRQIFTLFHELAHLLCRTSGIDPYTDAFIDSLPTSGRRIEITCNSLAAEFLLPRIRFDDEMQRRQPTEQTAELLAARYHLSREFIFRRFLDRGEVNETEYLEAAERWASQTRQGDGGNYYWTKITYLGTRYIGLAFDRYGQDRISETELADYLDIKVRNLPALGDHLARKRA